MDWIAAIQADARQGMVLAEKVKPLVDGLNSIHDLCQQTNLSFGARSFEANTIAGTALETARSLGLLSGAK